MADVDKLRARIVELARAENGRISPGDLHSRLARFHAGSPPVSRATFYTWFKEGRPAPQAFLECVPAFAHMFKVPEYTLWRLAGVIPPEQDAFHSLAAAAHDMRAVHRNVHKTLAESGLSTAGEALVVDRILHAQLDYHMEVWPVVRGGTRPLHLHSWIILKPISDPGSRRRLPTLRLESGDRVLRRRHIREEVIGEQLWRTLGLKWRDRVPPEFAHLGECPLFIEIPVEERIRVAPTEVVHPMFQVRRILVLGAPWSHAELMAALLAEALHWGSIDLRYLGYPPEDELVAKELASREQLAESPAQYVWAIAQRSDVMHRLRPDILAAAGRHLVVVVSYGPQLAEFVVDQWQTRPRYVEEARTQLEDLAREVAERTDVVRVHIEDTDVVTDAGAGPTVDRHTMTDTVRYLTAQVLNVLYDRCTGPGIPLWGDRFEDLRLGDEGRARVPLGDSTVRWLPRRRCP